MVFAEDVPPVFGLYEDLTACGSQCDWKGLTGQSRCLEREREGEESWGW
jgi:hypothetical protein